MAIVISSVFNTFTCSDVPVSITVFNETQPTQLYTNILDDFTIGVCGSDPFDRNIGCCISSLDTALTVYNSFTFSYMDADSQAYVPKLATGHKYCLLTSLDTVALNGSMYMYYLQDACVNGVICNDKGVNVYSDSNCVNLANFYTGSNISNSIIGNVSISYTVLTGDQEFIWTTFTPSYLLLPDNRSLLDILALLGFIIATLGFAITTVYYSYGYYRKPNDEDLYSTICQILWLIKTDMWFAYNYTLFTNSYVYYVFCSVLALIPASLGSSLISTTILLNLLQIRVELYRYAMYIMIICLNLGLNSYYYTFQIIAIYNQDLYSYMYATAFQFQTYWELFTVVYDNITPVLILIKILNAMSHKNRKMSAKDWAILPVITLQISNAAFAVFLGYVQDYTEWLGNERHMMDMNGFFMFVYFIHSHNILVMFHMLKKITKKNLAMKGHEDGGKNEKNDSARKKSVFATSSILSSGSVNQTKQSVQPKTL
ncbi:hypothetical protein HK103_006919 [Boothiomyces macroporosus]|uniref:Uncharacterized protein n=1 Tax=Boothiomyces macroporosus TaxID=261099 RepID=A0AAD5UL40_9FUNG|nr:hypothetical protein HK103_006919 [Boothiomyces macroporosus]